jgi:hypothetical protein
MFKRQRQVARVRDVMRADAERRRAVPAPAAPDLTRLEAEMRYHRDRLRLYRQRVISAKPTSIVRLRELERLAAGAVERLKHARRP